MIWITQFVLKFLTHCFDIANYGQPYVESAPVEITLMYTDPEFGRTWQPAFKNGHTPDTSVDHSEVTTLLIQFKVLWIQWHTTMNTKRKILTYKIWQCHQLGYLVLGSHVTRCTTWGQGASALRFPTAFYWSRRIFCSPDQLWRFWVKTHVVILP